MRPTIKVFQQGITVFTVSVLDHNEIITSDFEAKFISFRVNNVNEEYKIKETLTYAFL